VPLEESPIDVIDRFSDLGIDTCPDPDSISVVNPGNSVCWHRDEPIRLSHECRVTPGFDSRTRYHFLMLEL
jgi:hypothetical protein